MNTLVKKLAEQAGFTEWHRMDNPNGDAVIQALAELIIMECAGIYVKIDNGNQHLGTDNYLEALQKHFRVEE